MTLAANPPNESVLYGQDGQLMRAWTPCPLDRELGRWTDSINPVQSFPADQFANSPAGFALNKFVLTTLTLVITGAYLADNIFPGRLDFVPELWAIAGSVVQYSHNTIINLRSTSYIANLATSTIAGHFENESGVWR